MAPYHDVPVSEGVISMDVEEPAAVVGHQDVEMAEATSTGSYAMSHGMGAHNTPDNSGGQVTRENHKNFQPDLLNEPHRIPTIDCPLPSILALAQPLSTPYQPQLSHDVNELVTKHIMPPLGSMIPSEGEDKTDCNDLQELLQKHHDDTRRQARQRILDRQPIAFGPMAHQQQHLLGNAAGNRHTKQHLPQRSSQDPERTVMPPPDPREVNQHQHDVLVALDKRAATHDRNILPHIKISFRLRPQVCGPGPIKSPYAGPAPAAKAPGALGRMAEPDGPPLGGAYSKEMHQVRYIYEGLKSHGIILDDERGIGDDPPRRGTPAYFPGASSPGGPPVSPLYFDSRYFKQMAPGGAALGPYYEHHLGPEEYGVGAASKPLLLPTPLPPLRANAGGGRGMRGRRRRAGQLSGLGISRPMRDPGAMQSEPQGGTRGWPRDSRGARGSRQSFQ